MPNGTISTTVSLTRKEVEIIKLLAAEKTTKEIASILQCAIRTVEKHKSNLCHKTKSFTVIGIVLFGIESGIVKITIMER